MSKWRDYDEDDADLHEAPLPQDENWDVAADETLAPVEPCPYCHQSVSQEADVCPHCRSFILRDEPEAKPSLWVLGGVALSMMAVGLWLLWPWGMS